MKLIREHIEQVETLTEGAGAEKKHFIHGIFLQSDIKNRNGRLYPKSVLESQVLKYQTKINEKSSTGELGHPPGPQINLDRVSHLITELNWNGPNVYGKAKILETPCGKIVKSLLDEDIRVGVSSRGLGTLKPRGDLQEVQADFNMVCVDIVNDPSAPEAFVRGVMEGAEWIWDSAKEDWVVAKELEEQQSFLKKASLKQINEHKIRLFSNFLDSISKN